MDESGFMHLFGAKWVRYAMQYAGGGQRGVKLRSVRWLLRAGAGDVDSSAKVRKCVGERLGRYISWK